MSLLLLLYSIDFGCYDPGLNLLSLLLLQFKTVIVVDEFKFILTSYFSGGFFFLH